MKTECFLADVEVVRRIALDASEDEPWDHLF